MTGDMNAQSLEDGQTISTEVLKAWIVAKTDVLPLSSRWKSILGKRGEIRVDGWSYFFKAVEHDQYLVRRFDTEEVSDFHRNFYGGRLESRMNRHFIFQNFIFIVMAAFVIVMIVSTAMTFTRDGALMALCWSALLFVLWYGLRTLP